MTANLIPLLLLSLVIITAIVGTGLLVWYSGAGDVRGDKIKRDNKGRRSSDQ